MRSKATGTAVRFTTSADLFLRDNILAVLPVNTSSQCSAPHSQVTCVVYQSRTMISLGFMASVHGTMLLQRNYNATAAIQGGKPQHEACVAKLNTVAELNNSKCHIMLPPTQFLKLQSIGLDCNSGNVTYLGGTYVRCTGLVKCSRHNLLFCYA